MCTVIRKRYWGHPKIAKKDIPVYKTGYGSFNLELNIDEFVSIYQKFRYLVDKVYNALLCAADEICVSDNIEDIFRDTIPIKEQFFIGSGFHSFLTIERTNQSDINKKDALFIIPKGALYYSNKAGNAVSNQIIFKHFI